ncbi:ornithine carbamoyltransferase [Candidatus Marinimicrobia bacterium]|nr:ornithine carbamoyltransferase [Candidatus Neomarinimicrobiota bacterium]
MSKHFLHLSDYTNEQIWEILHLAKELKAKFHKKESYKPFKDQSLAMIFAKPSARTRVSFETGFEWMGGHALFLGPNDIGIGKREAIKDISRLFSRYNDVVMARLFDHNHILELAKYSDIPVINGLTDYNHPCQIMADVMTIWEHRKNLDNLKITYMGDGNNIVHSWLQMATRIPMHFVCCSPSGFEPDQKTVKMIEGSGISTYELSHNPTDAVEGADVIYTDVWASMGQKDEATERQKVFSDYQVNDSLMDKTGKETLFMHCLPAERGREVTDSVMESEFSIVFDEAENRMHAQNAIMVYLKNN